MLRRLFPLLAARKRAKTTAQEAASLLAQARDLLEAADQDALRTHIRDLRALRRCHAPATAPKAERIAAIDEAVAATRETLGTLFAKLPPRPHPVLFEIVETLVVAFGVAFAFRAYFFQPFKIPTGSMQPTLYGVHSRQSAEPTFFDLHEPFASLQWAINGRRYVDATAPANGTVTLRSDSVSAPGFLLLNLAGQTFKIPTDVMERREIDLSGIAAHYMADNPETAIAEGRPIGYIRKGERIWSGYVYAGDQVFVNRFLWNFRPPRRDEVVVFATSSVRLDVGASPFRGEKVLHQRIPFYGLPLTLSALPIPGLPPSQHYIKRLIGLPGETVSIAPPGVRIDGEKPEACPGIARVEGKDASETGPRYAGYHCTGDEGLPRGQDGNPIGLLRTSADSLKLGDAYLPMGDNTRNSYDGRYWGPVPRTQMLGPAACVYWPFSVRWGGVW